MGMQYSLFKGCGYPVLCMIFMYEIFKIFRIMLQYALTGSYERRGIPFWLSPLADPLAAMRILLSSVRRPRSWRGRAYSFPA